MTTAEELIQLYDSENKELRQEVIDLKNRIAILESNKEIKKSAERRSLLTPGKEKELYPGEIKELLMDILKSARRNVKDKTRRADILDDLIEMNPVTGIPLQQARKIREALKGYRSINDSLCRKLKEIGIDNLKQGRTHIRFCYHGDKRYVAYMATSGSDSNCGGQNLAHDIALKFF